MLAMCTVWESLRWTPGGALCCLVIHLSFSPQKAFDVLFFLLQNPNRLVHKEELLRKQLKKSARSPAREKQHDQGFEATNFSYRRRMKNPNRADDDRQS
jgi:hypothetical protein